MKSKRISTAFIFSILIICGLIAPVLAADAPGASMNAFCPVRADKASRKVSYEYQGKKYYFCCRDCVKKFKKNPEKYLAQLNSQVPISAVHEHAHS